MKDFFAEVEKIDDSPDMEGVEEVVRNKTKFQLETIDELMDNVSNLDQTFKEANFQVKGKMWLGPTLDGPRQERWQMVYHIKEEFLKYLESQRALKNLRLDFERVIVDEETHMTEDVLTASFAYIPSNLVEKLAQVKRRLEAREAERVSTAQEEETKSTRKKPYTDIKGKTGYLILSKKQRIQIGRTDSAKFILLQILCGSFGAHKAIEYVFGEMYPEQRRSALGFDPSLDKRTKLEKIKNQFKELKRGRGKPKNKPVKLGFALKNDRNSVWFDFE